MWVLEMLGPDVTVKLVGTVMLEREMAGIISFSGGAMGITWTEF